MRPRPSALDCTRPVQDLTSRLAEGVRRPWPETPVPVALVITDLNVGGAERMLVALATRLDRRRWRPVGDLPRAGRAAGRGACAAPAWRSIAWA